MNLISADEPKAKLDRDDIFNLVMTLRCGRCWGTTQPQRCTRLH